MQVGYPCWLLPSSNARTLRYISCGSDIWGDDQRHAEQ
jgi:hypothetical protein